MLRPMGPGPSTTALSPALRHDCSTACRPVPKGSSSAACSMFIVEGTRCAFSTGATVNSAKAPESVVGEEQRWKRPARHGPHRPQWPNGSSATRSPTLKLVTCAPTSTTSPAGSWPRMTGSRATIRSVPSSQSTMCRSEPHTPHAPTRTSNVESAGAGTGVSISSAPGAGRVFAIALIRGTSEYLQYDGAAVRVKKKCRLETFAEAGTLFPVAQRGAAITHARTYQTVVSVLLQCMCDPSGGAANRENCRRHRALKTEHADAYGEVEVEIGAQAFAFGDGGFDFERGLKEAPAAVLGYRLCDLPQQRGARIAVWVDRVTKARRQAMLAGECSEAFVDARAGFELSEHCLDSIARTAVNGSAQRTQRGEHGGKQVGAGARDDAGGEGRGVELMLGARDQHAIEGLNFPLGSGRAGDPSEQATGHAGAAGRAGCGRLRECERKLTDNELGAIDSRARRL